MKILDRTVIDLVTPGSEVGLITNNLICQQNDQIHKAIDYV